MDSSESFSMPTVGTSVRDASGEDIGTLSDIVFDASTGRLRFAVMEIKSDATQLVVPWEALSFRPGYPPSLNLTVDALRAAPRFDGYNGRGGVAETRWNREPYSQIDEWRASSEPSTVTLTESAGTRHRLGLWGVTALIACVCAAGVGYLILHPLSRAQTGGVQRVVAVVASTGTAVKETSADAATTVKVKTALALSKRVPALHVGVKTQHAVATLTGEVASAETRDVAGQIAADTTGVREVRNLLAVDSATP